MSGNEILLAEGGAIIKQIDRWRAETVLYRWINIILFMTCKIAIPAGSLIVAANLALSVVSSQFIDSYSSTILAIAVSVLASLEAMLNPSEKKRVAFTLNNELRLLRNTLHLDLASKTDDELRKALVEANIHLRDLLNKYSQNGY